MPLIACLGWGSLVGDPRELPIRPEWFADGPFVNIDFLRQSQDGRMTLVLDEVATPVRSLWAQMDAPDLAQARDDLHAREGVPKSAAVKCIGTWSRGGPSPANMIELDAWAQARGVDHVVWTALPATFDGNDRTPTVDEVRLSARPSRAEARQRRTPTSDACPGKSIRRVGVGLPPS